jgi:hypothetical protein
LGTVQHELSVTVKALPNNHEREMADTTEPTELWASVKRGVLIGVALLAMVTIGMTAYVQLRFGGVHWWSWCMNLVVLVCAIGPWFHRSRPRLSLAVYALTGVLSLAAGVGMLANWPSR